jgi:uncharacterized tellurite resistance protein B-like protein
VSRRRKGSSGGLAGAILGAIILAVAAIPKEMWIGIGIVGVLALVVWLISKSKETTEPLTQRDAAEEAVNFEPPPRRSTQRLRTQEPKGRAIPPRWIPASEAVEVAGTVIPGGMLYFGSGLIAASGDIEPAIIDPRQPVARETADLAARQMDYWPSYASISPSARRCYIDWLASGRSDPQADVGYVFLYFYGLERRALVDAASDSIAKADLPAIEHEVRRLLRLYGHSRSFRRYASSFLDYLVLQQAGDSIDEAHPPEAMDDEMSLALRLGLGRMAMTGRAVPAEWAYAWMRSDPRIPFPKALQRCPSEFEKLFVSLYGAHHGEGIKLPANRTKLRLSYRPASGGLMGTEFPFATAEVPDVTAVVAPARKIDAIVEACAEALAPYSRYIGKNPDQTQTLEAILLLPQALWPPAALSTMQTLNERIGSGLRVMSLGELASSFGTAGTLTRDRVRSLAHALEEIHIGLEPDVLAGARTPKADDRIILFRTEPEDGTTRQTPVYQAASVTLDLACSVAMADGKPHANELRLLMKQIDGWTQLTEAQRKRLRARLRMAIDAPPSLASLRSKLEVIPVEGRRAIAHLLSTLAQADGSVDASEVRMLEKIYRALDIDAEVAYSDLHAAAASVTTQAPTPPAAAASTVPATGIVLDMARIEALQRETAQVSALLSKVFADETASSIEALEEREETQPVADSCLIGLDAEHSIFLRLLLTRTSWPRQDLTDAAADMELMLDGALERINEASFAQFDEALIEGDDPVEISREVLEKIAA